MENDLTAVLELGSSTTTLALGEIGPKGDVRVLAMAQTSSAGSVAKSRITDIANVSHAISALAREIESKTEYQIGSANLVVSGAHVAQTAPAISCAIEGGTVTQQLMDSLADEARDAAESAPGRTCLHLEESSWRVDDIAGVPNPEGMSGSQLVLDCLCIDADAARVADARKAASVAKMEIEGLIPAGVAAALGAATPADRAAVTLFVDLGAGTTNWTLLGRDEIVAFGSLGVGADHVTADVSRAFSCSQNSAGNLKRQASAVLLPERRAGRLEIPATYTTGTAKTISRMALDTVVNARLRETLGIVRTEMERKGVFHMMRGGVVLTGGGALIQGAAQLAESVFGCAARIGALVPEVDFSACKASLPPSPAMLATVAGAFVFLVQNSELEDDSPRHGIWSKISGMFTRQ